MAIDVSYGFAGPSGSVKPGDMGGVMAGVRAAARASGQIETSVHVDHVTRAGRLDFLDRKPGTERDFWRLATKNVFAHEPDWQQLTRRRLEALN